MIRVEKFLSQYPKVPSYVGMSDAQFSNYVIVNRIAGRAMNDIQRDIMRIAWAKGFKLVFHSENKGELS